MEAHGVPMEASSSTLATANGAAFAGSAMEFTGTNLTGSAGVGLTSDYLTKKAEDEKTVQKAEVRTEPEDVKKQWILETVYDAVGHELCPDIQKREDWEMRFDSRGKIIVAPVLLLGER